MFPSSRIDWGNPKDFKTNKTRRKSLSGAWRVLRKLIKFEGSDNDEKIAKTKEWIASGESTIYEATFKFDDIV